MPENPFTSDEEQFGYFIEAMSEAFEDVDIPDGVIDGENIMDGTIRPEKVALDANWEFSGRVESPNLRAVISRSAGTRAGSNTQRIIVIYDDHVLAGHTIVLADAMKKIITVTLPLASTKVGTTYTIKRLDDNNASSVRLQTSGDDKLDQQTLISIPERGSLMIIAFGIGWHILANYS
tara:strand:+ start:28877 stop:29410 length:534 start_codon:yes stop_codon:yes gene_type:complete